MHRISFRLFATWVLLGGGCTGVVGNAMPSGGPPPPDDPMVKQSAQCLSAPMATGTAYLRRLTRWEYANTVTDTLSVRLDDAALGLIPSDIRANGFSNDFGGQLATFENADHYDKAAEA